MADTLNPASIFDVKGIVAVISGGGSGIGALMARTLAANGASKVYTLGRRLEKLQEVAASHPSIIVPIACDVTKPPQLKAAAEKVASETGYVNLVIANSGVVGPGVTGRPYGMSPTQFKDMVFEWSLEDLAQPFEVNVVSVLYTGAAFLELLVEGNKKGNMGIVTSQMLVTTSAAGFLREGTTPFGYMTSKAGANQLVKALATWWTEYDVRVNGIAPGLFPSEMSPALIEMASRGGGKIPKELIPLQRIGAEHDMAGTLLWIASKGSAFVTGNITLIDGGRASISQATY